MLWHEELLGNQSASYGSTYHINDCLPPSLGLPLPFPSLPQLKNLDVNSSAASPLFPTREIELSRVHHLGSISNCILDITVVDCFCHLNRSILLKQTDHAHAGLCSRTKKLRSPILMLAQDLLQHTSCEQILYFYLGDVSCDHENRKHSTRAKVVGDEFQI